MSCFTKQYVKSPYTNEMTRKIWHTPRDLPADLRTDYALIAAGVGAALIALIYLLLT